MTTKLDVRRAVRVVAALCAALVMSLGWASTASAHTDFVSSTPEDQSTVDGPLTTVTVTFTNPATESGDGFQLLQPDGTIREPDKLDPTDGRAFIATFDPPLGAGTYGFKWKVQAGDAHPIDGSFQFTVNVASPPTTAPPTPATTTPPTDPAVVPATTTATTPPAPAASTPVSAAAATAEPAATTIAPGSTSATLDEFLTTDDGPGPLAGRIARTITMFSTVFAVGVVAALVWVVSGSRDEIEQLIGWVRLAGLGLVTGGVAGFAVLDEIQNESRTHMAASKPGIAALLAIVGGVLVAIGFRPGVGALNAPTRSLSAAGVVVDRPSARVAASSVRTSGEARWRVDATAAVGLAGLGLSLVAYWFDGHTVSRGAWPLHAAVDLVHVGAASVWVGGVFAITILAWIRKRRHTATGLAHMVVRFSTIAGISLAALTLAGLVMAWMIVGSPGEIFSSSWGRVLAIKIGAVAAAAATGAFNHFALRPKLAAHPDDTEVAAQLRTSLLVESGLMLVVIVITAVLVASAT